MVYSVRIGRSAKKYLKKLKEKKLKELFTDSIYKNIAANPEVGVAKVGDLAGYFTYGFTYQGSQYRIAYTVNENNEIIIIVLAGSHADFYKHLKRIIKTF